MDKLGVDQSTDQEELEKKAAQGCPLCGRTPERLGSNVLTCSTHGTEPFERKHGSQETSTHKGRR